eukprot:CAMPEP_0113935160 /NCGR_PEP_ID=MMETSP1339-20121228/2373_1 /TAXON_ID=94617 /ORGANISM="Fibrocapsa japonica" /LENGTH=555 /DNA_ID=CAMNT_0000937217 /DNA_START=71 /DNA_END=1738 /DNA_ORIENTATION=- /assembly_acc=CAM_ASM_000762
MIENARKLRHRGPDWSGYQLEGNGKHGIAHERLAIMDPESGAQPLVDNSGELVLAANGEIYNYQDLYKTFDPPYEAQTGSDCEVLLPAYHKFGVDFVKDLRGMFAFVVYDRKTDSFMATRDHIGICPLYVGWGADGSIWFASEMKALNEHCATFKQFPPGHTYSSKTGHFVEWYTPTWRITDTIPTLELDLAKLREAFETAVIRRMMSDVPWGVLLSGGLDSSLVSSVAARHMADNPDRPFPRLHSFSVGLKGSPDLQAAQEVADFLGTKHHSMTYTIQEGIDAVREVIHHLETYDLTTIRASTPMFLMSRKIKALGIKMVLSGEGADEIFGGYLYFHKAPNAKEFFEETKDKISALHMYDCLRANKATQAWGIEARVPFLDLDFMEVAMNIDPEEKMIKGERIEKWMMRKAFDDKEKPFLPDHILWRQKEQFSDGVGYGWIDSLKEVAATHVSDSMMANAKYRFPHNTPLTKEAYHYRMIFEEFYPQHAAIMTVPGGPTIACSTPRAIEWDESFKNRADPSGRAVLAVHDKSYGEQDDIHGTQATGDKRKRTEA